MEKDILKQIQDLRTELELLQQDFENLSSKEKDKDKIIEDLKKILESHTHNGEDKTTKLRAPIDLPDGTYIKTGCVALDSISAKNRNDTNLIGALITGTDTDASNGSENTQLIVQHSTTGLDSFFYGNRKPIYNSNDASITSGGTTMTQSSFNWTTNELDGAYVLVYTTATEFDFFEIASNTATQLTITGGTWSSTESGAEWVVFMPVYFGSSQFPWRRLYTMEGTSGGIRIGGGDTNGGQNGLLYMDATGDLYWRNKGGTSTKLN